MADEQGHRAGVTSLPSVSGMSSTPTDEDRPTGPRRVGLMFAAIWLFYLLSPLSAAWDRQDLRGWIGIVATPRCTPRRAWPWS